MMTEERLAQELRLEFDQSFAEAPRTERERVERFLAVRVGGDPFVVRLNDIAGLAVGRKVVPVPTPISQLLGVIGNRGAIVPVYDLAALLGYARQPASKWLLLCGTTDSVALSCEEVSSYIEIAEGGAEAAAASAMIQTEQGLRRIIDLAAVMAEIALHAARKPKANPTEST